MIQSLTSLVISLIRRRSFHQHYICVQHTLAHIRLTVNSAHKHSLFLVDRMVAWMNRRMDRKNASNPPPMVNVCDKG